jgi:general secretion pathway protein N
MPMEGDQGGWTLTRINERSAIFREASGDEVEVELSTAVASPNPNARAAARNAAPVRPGMAVPPKHANQNDKAQALQKRIEERRAQMREEAERLRRQKAGKQQ